MVIIESGKPGIQFRGNVSAAEKLGAPLGVICLEGGLIVGDVVVHDVLDADVCW